MSSVNINSIDNIAVIGSGWLGHQIFNSLKGEGLNVIGTKTKDSDEKFHRTLRFPTNNYSVVSQSNIFIINIPPSKINEEDLKNFRDYFKDRFFIFISSTSVFDSSQGLVNEMTPPASKTVRGKKNIALEHIFKNDCIIRCGGLIGPGRHPIKSLQDKSIEGENLINLIHSEDVIGILKLVLKNKFQGIINASFPTDMTKKEYYTKYAEKYHFSSPIFMNTKKNELKIESVILKNWKYEFLNDLF